MAENRPFDEFLREVRELFANRVLGEVDSEIQNKLIDKINQEFITELRILIRQTMRD